MTEEVDIEENLEENQLHFSYNVDDYTSKPLIAVDSGIPSNLATLHHSFGYDGYRRDNLGVLSEEEVCYISGNYLEILNIKTKDKIYVRSCSGHGISCLAIHPDFSHIALGETGEYPMICLYTYKELTLDRIMKDGTRKSYACIQFNPKGELLASIGSSPDYTLTIWDWRSQNIVLRTKAFSQDVFRVSWSSDFEGILNTVGTGHIRFWKMANSFTGLKLQGTIGRFGKSAISDIEGFVALPDGKVLSGCEWGNLLVWDDSLIKVEISRPGKRPCHGAPIMQIVMDEGELMSVGFDGCIRSWDFETIDTAECTEEGVLYELDPMNELCVKANAKLMYMVKSPEVDASNWFAQDANGCIWKLDLTFTHTSKRPEPLFRYHSNAIMDVSASPCSHTCSTIGQDGCVCIYDILDRKVIVTHKFSSPGSRLIWNPVEVDAKGKTLLAGFEDGVIRVLQFAENLELDPALRGNSLAKITLIQALKPHTDQVSAMAYDPHGEFLATGSIDRTVFFFQVHSTNLTPMNFIQVPKPVRNLQWTEEAGTLVLVIYMDEGIVQRYHLPKETLTQTYELVSAKPIDSFKLKSITALYKLKKQQAEIKTAFMDQHTIKVELINRKLNRTEISEEDAQKQLDELEKERKNMEKEVGAMLPEVFPEDYNILWGNINQLDPDKFWLSMSGKDAGFFMDCSFPSKMKKRTELTYPKELKEKDRKPNFGYEVCEPNMIFEMEGIPKECASNTMVFSRSGKRMLMGTNEGDIYVYVLEVAFDLTKIIGYWALAVHDSRRGSITRCTFSFDERFILSVGRDGTFFVFELMDEELQNEEIREYRARIPSATDAKRDSAEDIEDPKAYSIEEHKQKSEHDKLVAAAELDKQIRRKKLNELRLIFKELKDKNESLPERLQLANMEYIMVPEIRQQLFRDRDDRMQLLLKETAWDTEKTKILFQKLYDRYRGQFNFFDLAVHSFSTSHVVQTIRGLAALTEHVDLRQQMLQDLAKIDRTTTQITSELSKV
ncbi:Cilia- and flagella-associated protein 44 [Cichlidogyrus casuarinus]|uniref:Cilia- and flagella-associated protein 44 n=1 Tax=Cichlidogyrus casuarinus TaxID=1844966 RepID=A0ABD2QIY5_9PLAT